eukprot:625132_1
MSAFDWNDHPFYLDQYDNKFILWFDIVTLAIACLIISIIFVVWLYQLFIKKAPPRSDGGSEDSIQSSKDDTTKNGKKKPKIDMSIPTLTAANKATNSVPETSKSGNDAKELSHSNEKHKSQQQASASTGKESAVTNKHRAIHPVSKCLVTTSIACATVYLWCLTTFAVLCMVYHHPPCPYYSLIFEIIYVQRICLYFYYFHRLYLSFQGTVYAMNKRTLIILATGIAVFWFAGQVFYFVWNSMVGDCTELSILIAIIPLGLTETFTSVLCVWLFVKKLKSINITKKQGVDTKVQYLISKLTILAVVTIASTFCVLGLFPFTYFLGLMAIDTPVNIICLVLSFGFYDKYYRMLCGPCRKIADPSYNNGDEQNNNTV